MSLQPHELPPIPEETAQLAQRMVGHSPYVRMGTLLGAVFEDADFTAVYPPVGTTGMAPWRLALLVVIQYLEQCSDLGVMQALPGRIDWKYVLRMPVDAAAPDPSVLTDFRQRLVAHGQERLLFDLLVDHLRQAGFLQETKRQRTDAAAILAKVKRLQRVEVVWKTVARVLDLLASEAPELLAPVCDPVWYDRYDPQWWKVPPTEAARQELAEAIGHDGQRVLSAIPADHWLWQTPSIQGLVQIWAQQYRIDATGLHWRTKDELPAAEELLQSPVDPEARFGRKREETWVGYTAQVTETYGPGQLPLIVDVDLHAPSIRDHAMLDTIHTREAAHALTPEEHVVDAGYVTAQTLTQATQRGIRLLGPPLPDQERHRRPGYTVRDFQIDWEHHQVTCPQGQQASSWHEAIKKDHTYPVIQVAFLARTCAVCPVRTACTSSTKGRRLGLHRQEAQEALHRARDQMDQPEHRAKYGQRAGSEGTFSGLLRTLGMRTCRYYGQAKTLLQVAVTASALNLRRVLTWSHEQARAFRQRSHFRQWYEETMVA